MSKPRQNTRSAVIGGGTGAGIIGLTKFIPESYQPLNSLLVYVAPTLSVILSILWARLSVATGRYFYRRKFDVALKESRQTCEEIRSNPASTDQHKQQAQQAVEKLETLKLEMSRKAGALAEAQLSATAEA